MADLFQRADARAVSNAHTESPSETFYLDDIPARRLRPDLIDRETALEKAKALARAASLGTAGH